MASWIASFFRKAEEKALPGLGPEDTAETAVSLASLILFDAEAPISAENISKLVTAAKINNVEPYWAKIYAEILVGKDINVLLENAGGGSGSGGAAPAGEVKKVEAKKEEPKKSSSSSEAMGGGFDLFGGDD